ncbi:RCC1 domain-containing protein 1-like [Pectinophora gossypiella]|uniref:RCC1 domain-containing protein 1 n=1 Tax=Pectinophora gossypiella TaxID=13191 RepID=A0A1E1WCX6_PECGO|nr:RCC1 domain-containing protein 1-like [Pectinophora gossypiella]
MYLVAGSNLFGQWFCNDPIVSGFQDVNISEKITQKHDLAEVKISHLGWSYNILQTGNDFYLSGCWQGKENQLVKIDLPEDCKVLLDSSLTIVGNDYNLILVDKKKFSVWVINLEDENSVKKLSINVDTPLKRTSDSKRKRLEDHIIKVVATNNSCLYLTAEGSVYSGLLPSHLDTSHCEGKVCDIDCGYEHFILLTDAGKVYTWGNGRRLQLGHGDLSNFDLPTEVEALSGIKVAKVSAGGWHSLVLSEYGDVYAWGWNDTGQLGIKSEPDNPAGVLKTEGLKSYPLPTVVDFFDSNDKEVNLDVKDIACGSRHSTIILEDNSVWSSGCNKYGQLGFPAELLPTVNYFKKTFQCTSSSKLKCGLWSTILMKT